MDKTMLRQQALNLATMRAKAEASTDDVLADADKVLAWLSKDMAADMAASQSAYAVEQAEMNRRGSLQYQEPAPSEPAQHESAAAVVGQEPKGE